MRELTYGLWMLAGSVAEIVPGAAIGAWLMRDYMGGACPGWIIGAGNGIGAGLVVGTLCGFGVAFIRDYRRRS